jgi:hypothetical protein
LWNGWTLGLLLGIIRVGMWLLLLLGKGERLLIVIPSSGTVPDSAEGLSKRLRRRSRQRRAGGVRHPVPVMGVVWMSVVGLRMRMMETRGRRRNVGRRWRRWRLARDRVMSRVGRWLVIYR